MKLSRIQLDRVLTEGFDGYLQIVIESNRNRIALTWPRSKRDIQVELN